jgi:hypothetical protein
MTHQYTFCLTETQINKFNEWKKQFDHLQIGPIGGIFSFQFSPTSVGVTIVKVVMETGFDERKTKQTSTLNLTDYYDF